MADEQHPDLLQIVRKVDENKSKGRKRKETVERLVADKLPDGWIKEIRTKRVSGKLRKDSFYIEPHTEREFNSMVKVFRYLEAKEGDRDQVIPEQEDHSLTVNSPTEAEGQSPTGNDQEDAEITEQKAVESESKDGTMELLLDDDLFFIEELESNTGTEVKQNDQIQTPGEISVEDYMKDGCVEFSAEPSEDELWVMSWKDMYEILSRGCSCPPLPTSVLFAEPCVEFAYNILMN